MRCECGVGGFESRISGRAGWSTLDSGSVFEKRFAGVKMDLAQVMRDVVAPRPKVARRIVLIGAGGIAHDAHLPAYAKAEFPVAAVVDLDNGKAQALATKFGIPKVAATIDEAVRYAPKDCVFDCTVPAPAQRAVLARLPDGAAVLLQKPMGETLAEAEEILAICRCKGLVA